jgi:beta-lactamase class A
MSMTRRSALLSLGLLPFGFGAQRSLGSSLTDERFRELEALSQGRLGIAVLDLATGRSYAHRATERFPMCSTFKLLAVAAVLARVDRGDERLDRLIPFGRADLLEYAPATAPRAAEGRMSLADLCDAAITVSDNTAANLILTTLGGPGGVTAYARSLGDSVTRLDRNEPSLNEALPGDPRDTTTPAAMAANIQKLLAGDALSRGSRDMLTRWLVANRTGNARLRAGFPTSWRVAEKTGTGNRGTSNDVGMAWAPGREPIVVAAYLTGSSADGAVRDRTLAGVARAVADGV